MVKSLPVNTRDAGLILGLGRSPGAGNGNPLLYSYLENPMDKEPGGLQSIEPQRVGNDWSNWARVHGARTHTHTLMDQWRVHSVSRIPQIWGWLGLDIPWVKSSETEVWKSLQPTRTSQMHLRGFVLGEPGTRHEQQPKARFKMSTGGQELQTRWTWATVLQQGVDDLINIWKC